MENPYYVELTIDDNGEELIVELFKDKNLKLEDAKKLGGNFYMGGYIRQEEEVSMAPNFTLYPPTSIKKIRLISMSIVQAPPGLNI